MAFTLGQAPEQISVVLVRGADFVSSLRRKDGTSWPSGASLKLGITCSDGSVTGWPAEFTGPVASWNVDQVEVDAVVAKKPRSVRLWYVEGDLRVLWAQGELEVRN